MTETQELVPQAQQFAVTRSRFAEQVAALNIADQPTLDRAGEMIQGLKMLREDIDKRFKPVAQKAFEAHRSITALWKEHTTPVDALVNQLSSKVIAYRREEQRRREEQAAKEAEEQRKRDEETALRRAQIAEDAGEPELAETILERAAEAPTPLPAAPEPVKATGIDIRMGWDFEVVDQSKINNEYMKPDLVAIGKIVRASGMNATQLVGVGIRIFQKETVAKGR